MTGFSFSRLQGLSRALIALTATSAVLTAGCANMATTATGSTSMDSAAAITGKVHGGNQAVAFATVNLWYAGQGVPSPAVIGATTTSANDGAGSFHFIKAASGTASGNTYVCPSNNPLVYLVATGGNTLGTGDNSVNNSASVFLAPLGSCSAIQSSTFIDMTEVSTVATMAALQQYFTPTSGIESFSTDGTGLAKTAMANAFNTISNMVTLSTGAAVSSLSVPGIIGGNASGTSVTVTPETAKINHLANILASCINNASASATNCTTLFNNATPPDPTTTSRPHGTTFATATDVLQAIYYILTNPTNSSTAHLTALYNLSSAIGAPFQPALSSTPTDWTIGISYASSSTCGGGGHLIHSAQDLAIDTFGNVWLANNEAGGNLGGISPTGQPITCINIGTGANTGITIDSLNSTGSLSDIWLADSGSSNLYRYKPGGTTFLAFPTAVAPASNLPTGITADGIGNIYFTSTANTALYEIPGAVAAVTPVAPVQIATGIGPSPNRAMADGTAIWTTSGSTFFTRTVSATPSSGTGYTSIQITAPGPTNGVSVTTLLSGGSGKNYVYVTSGAPGNSIDQFSGSGTSYSQDTSWPTTGLSNPTAAASDGIQNVWAIDNIGNGLVEIGANLQQLSPTGGFQKSAALLGPGRALIIDQAGNVWVGLDGAGSITEIVGAAVPVYQPYATALRNDDFETIP